MNTWSFKKDSQAKFRWTLCVDGDCVALSEQGFTTLRSAQRSASLMKDSIRTAGHAFLEELERLYREGWQRMERMLDAGDDVFRWGFYLDLKDTDNSINIYFGQDYKLYWFFKAKNGELIARSDKGYDTDEEMYQVLTRLYKVLTDGNTN